MDIGQYNKNDRNGDLTPLGQQQASKTGLALVQSLQRQIYIFSLDIPRAKQTTEILQTTIPGKIRQQISRSWVYKQPKTYNGTRPIFSELNQDIIFLFVF